MIEFYFTEVSDRTGERLSQNFANHVVCDSASLYYSAEKSIYFRSRDGRCLVIGDFWEKEGLENKSFREAIVALEGFYYLFEFGARIRIGSSLFNLLPIYYNETSGHVSSSFSFLAQNAENRYEADRKFILEQMLFNYGFFNRTLAQGVSLLPCNHHLRIADGSFYIERHYNVREAFHCSQDISVKTRNDLARLFIETTRGYFPDEPFAVSFTSGFDGRTLVSCALESHREFTTFAFGKKGNFDVEIPMRNAGELGISFDLINLEGEEYLTEYLGCALDLVREFGGFNGFIYPHFSYSAKHIAKKYKYLFAGYMGSEIFRTSHRAGAVTSGALYDLFARDANSFRKAILDSPALCILNMEHFRNDLDELIEELIAFRTSLPRDLTLNQRFYVFVFEEVFRKLFGTWIKAQMRYVSVRVPFVDIRFLEALLRTGFAGANNDFFTENPLKRHRGQQVYAEVIRMTSPDVFRQKTGKGYRPVDLVAPLGWARIVAPFVLKRLAKRVQATDLDNLSIISGATKSKGFLQNHLKNSEYFNEGVLSDIFARLTPFIEERKRDNLLAAVSLDVGIKSLEKR